VGAMFLMSSKWVYTDKAHMVANFPCPFSDIAREDLIIFQYSDFYADEREREWRYISTSYFFFFVPFIKTSRKGTGRKPEEDVVSK